MNAYVAATATLMLVTASCTVYVGSLLSNITGGGTSGIEVPGSDGEIVEMDMMQVLILPVTSSIFLLLLFFFFDYLQYVLVAMLVFSSATALYQTVKHVIRSQYSRGTEQFSRIVASITTLAVVVEWIRSGNFICHDILGCCLCFLCMSTLRFPSLKIATLCLSLLFFYDIFWVFYSERFFSANVMVSVASKPASNPIHAAGELVSSSFITNLVSKNLELPIKLMFPNIQTGRMMILGLGDIALPGALVCLALRCDRIFDHSAQELTQDEEDASGGTSSSGYNSVAAAERRPMLNENDVERGINEGAGPGAKTSMPLAVKRESHNTLESAFKLSQRSSDSTSSSRISSYKRGASRSLLFQYAMTGYIIGLSSAFIGNYASGHAQPALLYLVPAVLSAVCGRAHWCGRLGAVWAGPQKEDESI